MNTWVAIGVPQHPHHSRALRYWQEEAAAEMVFCRQTSLGLLRVVTTPAAMPSKALSVSEAWEAYRRLRALPEVGFSLEPPGCEAQIQRWIAAGAVTPRLWTDAYLAAFAVAGGHRLVTFDRDFARFDGLSFVLLHP